MAFGDAMEKRLRELREMAAKVPHEIDRIAESATVAAIEVAVKATPPNGGAPLAGTNARTGELAQHWKKDSIKKPRNGKTFLINEAKNPKNDMYYASYVNDGHRVEKHFVPGLHVVGNHLDYDANYEGGLIVGTKTDYVKGLYMKEQAAKEYIRVAESEF